jgi:flagellar hook-basal body complex protein FliE
MSYEDYYNKLVNDLKNTYSPTTNDAINRLGQLTSQINPEETKQQYLNLIPLVQNVYDKLAAQLELRQRREEEYVRQEKTQEMGKQAQAAAAAGFSPTEGFDAALIRNIGKAYDKKLSDLADRYNIEQEKIAAEKSKDVQQVMIEAEKAKQSGLSLLADINVKIASLKQQQDALIRQAAKDILDAKTEQEKLNWQKYYQQALIDLQNRELDLTAEKIRNEKEFNLAKLGLEREKLKSEKESDALMDELKRLQIYEKRATLLNVNLKESLSQAINILAKYDTNKDKLLSKQEFAKALKEIGRLTNGDTELATVIAQSAMIAGDFGKWKW